MTLTASCHRRTRAQRPATAWPTLSLLTAAVLATGCGASGHPDAQVQSVSQAGSSPSGSPSRHSASATGSARSATMPAGRGPGACRASGLKLTIGAATGAAGSTYYPLDFTNLSGRACIMAGYPGVAFVTAPHGRVVGKPAVRNSAFPAAAVTLTPGRTAHASLQAQLAQNYPTSMCKPVTARWLQVYPPGTDTASYVALNAVTCTGHIPSGSTLGIYVVRPGATGP